MIWSVASFAALGASYLALFILLLTVWRGRRRGLIYLLMATAVSAAWALLQAIHVYEPRFSVSELFFLDILRNGGWILFLLFIAKQIGVSQLFRRTAWSLLLGATLLTASVWFQTDFRAADSPPVTLLSIAGLAVALIGILLIEQLLRNASKASRESTSLLALGLGGLFVYDIFLYSQGILLDQLYPTSWLARGTINLLFVPLIAVSVRRNPDWDLRIFVSRHVVFYSTSLILVGVYLVLMSAGGYLIKVYGGSWGTPAQFVFIAAAIFGLFILVFSNRMRARIRVWLNKHFFRNKYDYRDEWLRLIATLTDFQDDTSRHNLIKALSQIVDSPGGLLFVRDAEADIFALSAADPDAGIEIDVSGDDPLVEFVRETAWLVDLAEYERNPSMYQGLEIPAWLGAIDDAWLVIPLKMQSATIGFVVLYRAPGPPALNYEDRDLLKTVGNHIAVHIAQERSSSQLSKARQFEAFNRLAAFLMHDLNNLIAQQSLIVENAVQHKRNPDFVDDAMQTIASSVDRMKRVMNQLKRGEADSTVKPTELRFAASRAVDQCSAKTPQPVLTINDKDVRVIANLSQLSMVISHLIRNAQDSTPEDGSITVSVDSNDNWAELHVTDSGAGMSADFIRHRLFSPFDSTKGSQGMGIGAYQVRDLARKFGGDVIVKSTVGEGTHVTLRLPIADIASPAS